MKVNNHIIEPRADLEGADLEGANLRYADLEGADLRSANLRCANLQDTNLYGANLEDADLKGANLRHVNLFGVNLRGANLLRADLRGADLRGANLEGADLRHTKGIISFTLGKHFGFSYKRKDIVYVQIGCKHHTLEHWLTNVEAIGKANRYTEFEIECYKAQLNLIAVLEHRR